MKNTWRKAGWMAMGLMLAGLPALQAVNPDAGKKAADFTLTDIEGKTHKLSDYKGKFVVLEWVNHGCPFVKKHYNTKNMQGLQKEMADKGVVWLSICSSAKGKQGHYSAADWKDLASKNGTNSTAVLMDESGKVGKLYGAKTTPHMFVVNPEGTLIYQGAIDDKPSTDEDDVPGAQNYVRAAVEEALAGKPVSNPKTPSYGCSVKY